MTIFTTTHESAQGDAEEENSSRRLKEPTYPFEDMFTSDLLPVGVMIDAVEDLARYRKVTREGRILISKPFH